MYWTCCREYNGPVLVASSHGGTSIEDVAEKTPHLVKKIPIDIKTGLTKEMADDVADFLLFKGKSKELVTRITLLHKIQKSCNIIIGHFCIFFQIADFFPTTIVQF